MASESESEECMSEKSFAKQSSKVSNKSAKQSMIEKQYGRLYMPHLVNKWTRFSKKSALKFHESIENTDQTHDIEINFEDNPKMIALADILTQAE